MKTLRINKSTKSTKKLLSLIFILGFSYLTFAQGGLGQIESTLNSWKDPVKSIARVLIALGAIIGAVWVFFKMQSAEGGEGKKALMNYIGALAFGMLVWVLIEALL